MKIALVILVSQEKWDGKGWMSGELKQDRKIIFPCTTCSREHVKYEKSTR